MGAGRRCLLLLGAICLVVGLAGDSVAQERRGRGGGGDMSREERVRMFMERFGGRGGFRGGPPPGAGGGGEPSGGENKEGGDRDRSDGDEGGKEESEDIETITRPQTPPRVPDPREFDVKLDESGRVPPFNFAGQGWPDVLQWLAQLKGNSLDWRDLPADYVNLATDTPLGWDEVQDLVNRLLLARGFTMLQQKEVLSVHRLSRLDPSLIPRVDEEELYDLAPHQFVKVSFTLPEKLAPDKMAEDVKQLLSQGSRIMPLASTRRLLVIDAVANLRLVSMLLSEEQMMAESVPTYQEFMLRHARADQVIGTLYVILGMDPNSKPTQMELRVQQERIELMNRIQRTGKDVSSMLKSDGPPVYLAFNRQRNSVIANAPPEQMRIIERAIDSLDVPSGAFAASGSAGLGEGLSSRGAERRGGREGAGPAKSGYYLDKYQLVTMDPQVLQLTLEEIGSLSPMTNLRADTDTKTLFARATRADHETISRMIDKLDGSGRHLKVFWLRRLPADAVAASINNLLVGPKEEENDSRSSRRSWWYGGRDEEEEPKKNDGFRVDADVENNRLLLWANESEIAEVERFLAELGEIPGEGDSRTVRVVDALGEQTTQRLLDQLRTAWPSLGDNELIINQPQKSEGGESSESGEAGEQEGALESAAPDEQGDRSAHVQSVGAIRLVQLGGRAATGDASVEPTTTERGTDGSLEPQASSTAPVTISIGADGRLVFSSSDTAALDQLEKLVNQLTPARRQYKIFRLKYVSCFSVYLNLEEYFAEELGDEEDDSYPWWFGGGGNSEPKEPTGLSKRRSLRIIYDNPSNSILVAGASELQLQEIEQLIQEYDQPITEDAVRSRRTAAIKVRYSKATAIAAALKDAYRDLLSARDKEFAEQDERGGGASKVATVIRFGDDGLGPARKTPPINMAFDGVFSVGVDEVSNMLVVSAAEEIFDGIVDMITRLDEEARADMSVHVHKVSAGVEAESLGKALSEAIGQPWVGGRPESATGSAGTNRGSASADQEASRRRESSRSRSSERGRRDSGRSRSSRRR